MQNRSTSKSCSPWVDIFSEPYFQGPMIRLRGRFAKAATTFPNLPVVRSIIVGPDTTAKLSGRKQSRPIQLSARTVLADTTRLTRGRNVRSLAVVGGN